MVSETPFTDCTDFMDSPERLREHADEHGYLYFRKLLSPKDVNVVRHAILSIASEHNLLNSGYEIMEGIRRSDVFICEQDNTDLFRRFYTDVQRLRTFHAFPHDSTVLGILERFFGSKILVHPRHICHTVFPGEDRATTLPHQDFHPVRGSRDTWTVWSPLGDCDDELGGLAVADGSSRWGFLKDPDVRSSQAIPDDTEWAWNPFSCGDVLMFHSLTIHRGRPNQTGDRIRLATSARYQSVNDQVDGAALGVHLGCGTWEDIYSDWPDDDALKFYWKGLDLDLQPPFHSRKKD